MKQEKLYHEAFTEAIFYNSTIINHIFYVNIVLWVSVLMTVRFAKSRVNGGNSYNTTRKGNLLQTEVEVQDHKDGNIDWQRIEANVAARAFNKKIVKKKICDSVYTKLQRGLRRV